MAILSMRAKCEGNSELSDRFVIGWGYANSMQKLSGFARQHKQHAQADIRSNVVALALTDRYLSQHLEADLLQTGGTLNYENDIR